MRSRICVSYWRCRITGAQHDLMKYDAACRAVAEALSNREVKDIRDKAEPCRPMLSRPRTAD